MKNTKIFMASLLMGGLSLAGLNASALTYQEEVPVSFTFNGGISISLSSANLIITDLVPGTTDDSNIITVTTSSNVSSGYTLYATTGNSTTYPNTNLVNNDNTSSPKTINSLATNASIATMASADASTNGKWGYSYSSNNGSTWTNYSGLPLYTAETGAELIAVNSNTISSIKFKIGAKASANQASGEYKNVVNFIAIGNPEPMTMEQAFADAGKTKLNGYYRMQDMSPTICNNTAVIGDQLQLIDTRDNKTYYVSKLADGNCWMTQNLDHNIVTTANFYTPDNTDVPANWTANRASGNYWDFNSVDALSYDPGDVCWNGVILSSGGNFSDNTITCTDTHYHVGNYYNWAAAIATNNSNSFTRSDSDADQSICPAGWTLPKSGSNNDSGSFNYLVSQANLSSGVSGNIHAAPYYFVYGGLYYGMFDSFSNLGSYWSSYLDETDTSLTGGGYSYALYFKGNSLNSATSTQKYAGSSVRCVARNTTREPQTINNLAYMQDFATLNAREKNEVLNSMTVGEQYQLMDSRDYRTYYISKLNDGNVWMTQNLDHDITTEPGFYTPENTDIPADWNPEESTRSVNDTTRLGSTTTPESYEPGNVCWNGTIDTSYSGTLSDMTTTCTDFHYHIGNYYNWTAAVAMSDSSSYTTDNEDVDQSICPAGWTLPKSGNNTSSGSFAYLANQAGLTAGTSGNIHQAPYYFVYDGSYWDGSSNGVGGYGIYWSSVVNLDDIAYAMYFDADGNMTLDNFAGRGDGLSVRCVAR